ncbi:MAG: hypothetical protein IJ397_05810 [Lachnospiraceae bacterium]|nr:hypothetical protein [Lachnospiraceae bacterium]
MYANEQRDRAICIYDKGDVADIRFVDRYMNVNEALCGKRMQVCVDFDAF